MGGIVFIAGTAIKSAGKRDLSESVQKILINYLQVATLARAFPLRWPPALQALFEFQGAISTIGDHLVNPDCVATSSSDAELFYAKQLGFAMVPPITVAVAFLFWYSYGATKGPPFFKKRTQVQRGENQLPTPKDKFVVTVGAMLYFIFPTLVKQAFSLFDCKNIGGMLYLQASLEEECFTGQHSVMLLLLGIPQFVGFVVGLPVLLLFFLKRNRAKLQTHAVLSRYGLFYGAYKEERYYWELVIVLRKIFIVGISVFGPSLGPRHQAQLTLLVLLVCICLEVYGGPFRTETSRHHILPKLEFSSLIVEWLTMWSGLVIFTSLDKGTTDSVEILTVIVILINVCMFLWLILMLGRECVNENKESGAAQTVINIGNRVGRLHLRRKIQSMGARMSFGRSRGDVEMTPRIIDREELDWSVPINPMMVRGEMKNDGETGAESPPSGPVGI